MVNIIFLIYVVENEELLLHDRSGYFSYFSYFSKPGYIELTIHYLTKSNLRTKIKM